MMCFGLFIILINYNRVILLESKKLMGLTTYLNSFTIQSRITYLYTMAGYMYMVNACLCHNGEYRMECLNKNERPDLNE